jgi:hypothetical protein
MSEEQQRLEAGYRNIIPVGRWLGNNMSEEQQRLETGYRLPVTKVQLERSLGN